MSSLKAIGLGCDELLGILVPIMCYWIYAPVLAMITSKFPNSKLHSFEEEEKKNSVARRSVVIGVLLQQGIQAIVATLLYIITKRDEDSASSKGDANLIVRVGTIAFQFVVAMGVMDTWQYFLHRAMHEVRFMYKHVHSQHHRLVVPYSFGALYNHPVEGLLVDTLGGAMSFLISGMSSHTSIYFFTFATIKSIDDHSGLYYKWHPFHFLFRNNSVYHDIHHQLLGNKFNFSQPFFVYWDLIMGTYYMPAKQD